MQNNSHFRLKKNYMDHNIGGNLTILQLQKKCQDLLNESWSWSIRTFNSMLDIKKWPKNWYTLTSLFELFEKNFTHYVFSCVISQKILDFLPSKSIIPPNGSCLLPKGASRIIWVLVFMPSIMVARAAKVSWRQETATLHTCRYMS